MCCKCRTDKCYTADKGCCLPLLCLSFSYSQLYLPWHTALLLSSASGALCALLIHVCDWLPAEQLKPVIQHFSENHICAPIGCLLSPAYVPDQQETCLVFCYLYLDMLAVSRSWVFHSYSYTHTSGGCSVRSSPAHCFEVRFPVLLKWIYDLLFTVLSVLHVWNLQSWAFKRYKR